MPKLRKLLSLITVFCLVFSCESQSSKISYTDYLEKVAQEQTSLQTRYNQAIPSERQAIILETQNYLTAVITEHVFPYWYGTPWDFNGTSREPGKGEIACGYFVTTVLEDVGFNLPRVKWAQSASEVFIVKLAPNDLKRFQDEKLSVLKTYLFEKGDGLYLAGLDSHVGFVWVKANKIHFVHANYYQAGIGVMKEKIDTKNPLSDSHYVIFGKLLSEEMCVKWLTGEGY